MGLLLIIPILVGGFVYCHHHPLHRLKLHRFEGQYLYLESARKGTFLLLVAIIAHSLLLLILSLNFGSFGSTKPNYFFLLANFLVQHKIVAENTQYSTSLIILLSATIIFLPYPLSLFYKLWIRLRYIYVLWDQKLMTDSVLGEHKKQKFNDKKLSLILFGGILGDSPLDNLLYRSIGSPKQLMLTMNDRKVYVGRVLSMGEPNETEGADQEISFRPTLSGFRDKDTLTVTFTTHYEDIKSLFTIILKQENIVSATEFEKEIYQQFSDRNWQNTKEDSSPYKSAA